MIEDIDGGATEPLDFTLTNNGSAFDGSGYTVAVELLQVGGLVWHASTVYALGDQVRPTAGNGLIYVVTVAGTTDVLEPTWPTTPASTVLDGTVEFTEATPDVAWQDQPAGVVRISNYDTLPAGTSYRVRYAVTDGTGAVGYFPNKSRYDVWRIGNPLQS